MYLKTLTVLLFALAKAKNSTVWKVANWLYKNQLKLVYKYLMYDLYSKVAIPLSPVFYAFLITQLYFFLRYQGIMYFLIANVVAILLSNIDSMLASFPFQIITYIANLSFILFFSNLVAVISFISPMPMDEIWRNLIIFLDQPLWTVNLPAVAESTVLLEQIPVEANKVYFDPYTDIHQNFLKDLIEEKEKLLIEEGPVETPSVPKIQDSKEEEFLWDDLQFKLMVLGIIGMFGYLYIDGFFG